jgi:hypothetical protein
LERRNWTWYWDFGVKQFLKATDTNGRTRLLYVPPTGGRLIEINPNLSTDFGEPFKTSYISGLLPFSEDDTVFAKVKEVIVSLGRLKGTVNIEVLGIDSKKGFSTVGTRQVSDQTGTIPFMEKLFSRYPFTREGSPKTFSSANTKKRVRVNRKLNRIQIAISSNTAGTEYTILSWQAKGSISPSALPSSWK